MGGSSAFGVSGPGFSATFGVSRAGHKYSRETGHLLSFLSLA